MQLTRLLSVLKHVTSCATLIAIVISLCLIEAESAKLFKNAPNYKQPFVTFYGEANHRGKYYHHYLKKECTNLPSQYDNWASSINAYRRCVYVCDARDCGGSCQRIHGPGSKGQERLAALNLNDKVSSVKFCYTFAERTVG